MKCRGKDTNVIGTSIILLKIIHQQLSEITDTVLVPSIITLHCRIIQNGAFSFRYISSLASKEKYDYNTWQLLTSIHPVIHSTRADARAKRSSLASPRPLCPDVGSPGVPRPAGAPPQVFPRAFTLGDMLGKPQHGVVQESFRADVRVIWLLLLLSYCRANVAVSINQLK